MYKEVIIFVPEPTHIRDSIISVPMEIFILLPLF